jgi:GAF domain-containing protein
MTSPSDIPDLLEAADAGSPAVTRETQLAEAFVELADAMVSGRDVIDFLHLLCRHAVTLLDVSAAGVMLADEANRLRAIAASDEGTHMVEVLALQHEEGPCLDAYRCGAIVQASSEEARRRWVRYYQLASGQGFRWMCGVPLRHDGETLGAMNLFRQADSELPETHLKLAQALADIATIALVQRREGAQTRRLAANLQIALDSRILIEQAKGALAVRRGIPLDEAFDHMRGQARDSNRKLHDVAAEIVKTVDTGRLSNGEVGSA